MSGVNCSYINKRLCFAEKIHPGLLQLWDDDKCKPDVRWCLFTESLTQREKLDSKALQKLGLPYAVPVATLFYLWNVSICQGNCKRTNVHFCTSDAYGIADEDSVTC